MCLHSWLLQCTWKPNSINKRLLFINAMYLKAMTAVTKPAFWWNGTSLWPRNKWSIFPCLCRLGRAEWARKGKVAFVAGWRLMMVKQKALSNRRVSECGKICIYFMKLKKYDDKRHTLMLLCMHVVVLLCLSCTPEFNHDFRRPGYIYIHIHTTI